MCSNANIGGGVSCVSFCSLFKSTCYLVCLPCTPLGSSFRRLPVNNKYPEHYCNLVLKLLKQIKSLQMSGNKANPHPANRSCFCWFLKNIPGDYRLFN